MCLLSCCLINTLEECYNFCLTKRNAPVATHEKYMEDGPSNTDLAETRNSTPEHKACSGDEREPLLKLVLPATDVRYGGSNEYLSIQH